MSAHSRHYAYRDRIAEIVPPPGTTVIESVGLLNAVCVDVESSLRGGVIETCDELVARRLRTLLARLGLPTALESVVSDGRHPFTVHRIRMQAVPADHPLLRGDRLEDFLHGADASLDEARALWRGVLLGQPLQRRRNPGISIAVRSPELARLLVDTAQRHLHAPGARRSVAGPARRVVVEDVTQADRLLRESCSEATVPRSA